MNLSKVYYSQNQRMNHAAINPAFSFMYSATHQINFDKQYRFMDPKVADELLTEMLDKPVAVTDSIPQILNTQRPNIIFIILESFSTHLMETMGGQPNVAVNMDKFGKEGVLFTNFYANTGSRTGIYYQWLSRSAEYQHYEVSRENGRTSFHSSQSEKCRIQFGILLRRGCRLHQYALLSGFIGY